MSVHVKTKPTNVMPFSRELLHMLEQRPENSAPAKSRAYIHALYPPEISIPPITPLVSNKQLAYDRAGTGHWKFGNKVCSLRRVVQKRRYPQHDSLEIKVPIFSLERQTRIEFCDKGDVGLSGWSDVDVDVDA